MFKKNIFLLLFYSQLATAMPSPPNGPNFKALLNSVFIPKHLNFGISKPVKKIAANLF